jgi:hypothetical protein
MDAFRARNLPIKDARRMSQVALLNTKSDNQLRVAESSVAAPPATDTQKREKEKETKITQSQEKRAQAEEKGEVANAKEKKRQ